MKKILKYISNFIFGLLLIVLAISFYSWVQVNVLHKPYSSFMGYSIFEVVTGSMSGTIEINDYIIVKNDDDLKLKDIITFRDDNALVTHRIIELRQNSIVTKGDANNSEDIEITYDDVIGKVVYVIPGGAVWKRVFTDQKVLLLFFITMLFFSIYFSIGDKENKKIIKKEEEKIDKPMKTSRKESKK